MEHRADAPEHREAGQRLRRIQRWTPVVAALVGIAVACVGLLGWVLGNEAMVRVVPGAAVMAPLTAVGLLVASTALLLLRDGTTQGSARARQDRTGRMLGALAALIGLAVLLEYATKSPLGIDRLLFPEQLTMLHHPVPGRPTPLTAMCFVSYGLSLMLLDIRAPRGRWLSPVLAAATAFISILTLTGYGYGEKTLFTPDPVIAGLPSFAPIPIHTAAAFVLLSVGGLVARPHPLMVTLLSASDIGSFFARRLLPIVLLVPLVLGWVLLLAERSGLFGVAFGTSLLVVSVMVVLTVVVVWNAAFARRIDLQRQTAERALQESEERFRLVFQHAGIGIVVTDPAGQPLLVNPAFERLMGYPAKQLRTLRFRDITHSDDIEAEARLFAELARGERQAFQIEKRYVRADGGIVWGRVTATLARDASGRPRYAIGMVEDITARKASEAAQARLTAIIESAPDFVGTADVHGHVLSVNRSGREMVGRGDEDVTRLNIADFHPDWATNLMFGEALPTAIREGSWRGVSALLTRDGREIPVSQVMVAHKSPTGDVEFTSTIMRDITASKRQEEGQRFLADASRALSGSLEIDDVLRTIARLTVPDRADYCLIDVSAVGDGTRRATLVQPNPGGGSELTDLHWSEGADEQLGEPGPGGDEYGGVRIDDVSEPVLRAAGLSPEQRQLSKEVGARSVLVLPLRARGRMRGTILLIRTGGNGYDDEDLNLGENLAVRAALALDNARLYHDSQQATRVRDEVLRVVAHDLRNPLNTIYLTVGLLIELLPEGERPEVRQKLEMIGRSAERANRLIQDLLDVARLQAGQFSVEGRPTEADALVREAVEMHRAIADQKSIRIEAETGDRLPSIVADHDRVLQVFSNLIGNAIKFTPEGGRVVVRARETEAEVEFCVADNGPGIAEEDVPRLFSPFWQAGGTRREGAGLGLAIAKGIVEAHRGRMWVQTEPGAGSAFYFTVPNAGTALREARDELRKAG